MPAEEVAGVQESMASFQPAAGDDNDDHQVTEQDELALDDEASALLAELGQSQAEVKRMLDMQQEQASEIVHLRDELAKELSQLQDEAWRLQAVNELEVLKRQLEQLNNLEAGLDAAEAALDDEDQQDAAAAAPGANRLGNAVNASGQLDASEDDAEAAGCDDDDDLDDLDLESITQLQAQLDEDLASLMSRLNAVRNEASAVSARKDQLVSDLRNLLALQAEADDTTLEDHDQKLAAYEAALTSDTVQQQPVS